MKIRGPNMNNVNPYQNQLKKQEQLKQSLNKQDLLDISLEAKKLQKADQMSTKRAEYVQELKRSVESGEYKIDGDQIAQKMIDYWTKRS